MPNPPRPPMPDHDPSTKPEVDPHLVENVLSQRADAVQSAITTRRIADVTDRMRRHTESMNGAARGEDRDMGAPEGA